MSRGRRRREKPAAGQKGRRRRLKPIRLWREIPILLGIALLLALGIKTFMVQAFFIPSQSMENTIMPGDRVLVNKFSPWFGAQPQRGQIVVFHDPGGWLEGVATPTSDNAVVRGIKDVFTFVGLLPQSGEHDLIKRVIGVPGDRVACCNSQGLITVNGVALHEKSYLYPGNKPGDAPAGEEAHFRLSQAYRKLGETEKSKKELQTYKELSQKSAERIDRERREIPQFVYTLRAGPTTSSP